MKYASKVYSDDIYLGTVCANSFSALKRMASRKCNNYYRVFDTMIVYRAEDKDIEEVKFTRVNKKYPNNTIVRGCWA